MNAAFILLTSAWMAGADPVPAAPPAAAIHPAPAVVSTGSACGGGCGSTCGGCDSGCGCDTGCGAEAAKRKGLLGRIRGRFGRKGGDEGCGCEAAPCCAPAPVCKPACAPVCPPKPVCCAPAPVCAPAPCHSACNTCDACNDGCGAAAGPRQGLLAKIKAKFGRKKGGEAGCGCGDTCGGCDSCHSGCGGGMIAPVGPAPIAPAPAVEPKKMPTTIGGAPSIITPAKIGEESRNPFDLARRYLGKANASADYSQLTGQLFFVHTDGGRWVVRYAPISQEDRYGGSVILARDVNMAAFGEGDLITVKGAVLAEKTNLPLGGALYQATKLDIVERGQGLTAE